MQLHKLYLTLTLQAEIWISTKNYAIGQGVKQTLQLILDVLNKENTVFPESTTNATSVLQQTLSGKDSLAAETHYCRDSQLPRKNPNPFR